MAKVKQYLVDQTIETTDKSGKKLVFLRSDTPQTLPAAIAKEAVERKLARLAGEAEADTAAEGEGAGAPAGTSDANPGTGDGASGDA